MSSCTQAYCSGIIHRERRKYLRTILRELTLVITDEPGLLGPKILFVLMALTFSRDEMLWLLRHLDVWPQSSKAGGKTRGQDDLVDRYATAGHYSNLICQTTA
jgi:NCK-associated protein 1